MQKALNEALGHTFSWFPTEKQIDDGIQLIKLGADPNYIDNSANSAKVPILNFACGSRHVTTSQIRTLLSLGCDPMFESDVRETPLDRAFNIQRADIADIIFELKKISPNDKIMKYRNPEKYGTYVSSACSLKTYGDFEKYGKSTLELWKVLAKHGGRFSDKHAGLDGLQWYKTQNDRPLPQLVAWLESRIEEERQQKLDSESKESLSNKLEEVSRLLKNASALLENIYRK